MKTLFAKSDEDVTTNADELVKGIVKEIEPLLKGAGPFFGGSAKLTLAEVSLYHFLFYFFAVSIFSPLFLVCIV